MTIYVDVVFIENLIMNYIILLANAFILKIKVKQLRLVFASSVGAIYTVMAYIASNRIFSNFFIKLILSIIIVYIAFNSKELKVFLKQLVVFYLTSFVFGGAAFAFIYIIKPQNILMKNGLFLGTYTLKTVVISTIIAFVIIILTFRFVKNKFSKKDIYKEIDVAIEEKVVRVKAIVDTGNMLKEPITGKPVVVIEHTCFYNVLPKEILNNLEKILGGDLENISEEIKNEYLTRLKFIPFSSLGKQNGMILGISPQFIKICGEEDRKIKDIIVGIYNKSLTKDGSYRALIGMDII